MRCVPALCLFLIVLSPACDDGGLMFDAPSEEELRDRVHQEPTAALDAESLPWALEQTRHALSFSTAFLALTEAHATSFFGSDSLADAIAQSILSTLPVGLSSQSQALTYEASGYIDFACPGAVLSSPDYTFAYGHARLQSPEVIEVEDGASTPTVTVEEGAVFLMSFRDRCEVGTDVLGGDLYGVFETPWVFSAVVTDDLGEGATRVTADIELAANRFTAIFHDDHDDTMRLIVTHPQGIVTSATLSGASGTCSLDVDRDTSTGGYVLNDTAAVCDF